LRFGRDERIDGVNGAASGVSRPTATLFCGLPGSGKTTLARRLEAEGRGVRLCTDEWQARLGVSHDDTDFHERLQPILYEHGLNLLRHGVSVILEDGLWTTAERAQKFADARSCGARIELHIFRIAYATLWARLQQRSQQSDDAAYPITEDELRSAWSLFQPPSPEELLAIDSYAVHTCTPAGS
jgi:predicted kinase